MLFTTFIASSAFVYQKKLQRQAQPKDLQDQYPNQKLYPVKRINPKSASLK